MAAEDAMPSLLELARTRMIEKRATKCSIGKLLISRPELKDQLHALAAAAADPEDTLTFTAAGEALSAAISQNINGQTLSRHYRGACACS